MNRSTLPFAANRQLFKCTMQSIALIRPVDCIIRISSLQDLHRFLVVRLPKPHRVTIHLVGKWTMLHFKVELLWCILKEESPSYITCKTRITLVYFKSRITLMYLSASLCSILPPPKHSQSNPIFVTLVKVKFKQTCGKPGVSPF